MPNLAKLGRRVVLVIGGGSVAAAVVFLFGALVNTGFIKPEHGKWFYGALSAAYATYGPGFILLVLGMVGLLIMHERAWLLLLDEKNKEITRLVEQRNRLEEIVLRERGSSNPDSPSSKKRR